MKSATRDTECPQVKLLLGTNLNHENPNGKETRDCLQACKAFFPWRIEGRQGRKQKGLLMSAPTPKSDQLRQLREAKFASKPAKAAPAKAAPEKMAVAREAVSKVVNKKVNKPPTKAAPPTVNAQYQATWRKANPELARQRTREGMRKRRANAPIADEAPHKGTVSPDGLSWKRNG